MTMTSIRVCRDPKCHAHGPTIRKIAELERENAELRAMLERQAAGKPLRRARTLRFRRKP